MLNLIHDQIDDQTEESPLVAFYQSLLSLGFLPGDYIPYIGYLLYNLEWNKRMHYAMQLIMKSLK